MSYTMQHVIAQISHDINQSLFDETRASLSFINLVSGLLRDVLTNGISSISYKLSSLQNEKIGQPCDYFPKQLLAYL